MHPLGVYLLYFSFIFSISDFGNILEFIFTFFLFKIDQRNQDVYTHKWILKFLVGDCERKFSFS